eukprot:g1614.t1
MSARPNRDVAGPSQSNGKDPNNSGGWFITSINVFYFCAVLLCLRTCLRELSERLPRVAFSRLAKWQARNIWRLIEDDTVKHTSFGMCWQHLQMVTHTTCPNCELCGGTGKLPTGLYAVMRKINPKWPFPNYKMCPNLPDDVKEKFARHMNSVAEKWHDFSPAYPTVKFSFQ